jgi:hypothetical protein
MLLFQRALQNSKSKKAGMESNDNDEEIADTRKRVRLGFNSF